MSSTNERLLPVIYSGSRAVGTDVGYKFTVRFLGGDKEAEIQWLPTLKGWEWSFRRKFGEEWGELKRSNEKFESEDEALSALDAELKP